MVKRHIRKPVMSNRASKAQEDAKRLKHIRQQRIAMDRVHW